MLEEPPVLQVRRLRHRPERALLARFADVPTGFLVDCMDGRGALDHRVKPVDPQRAAFAGVAVTCLCGPGDNLAIVGALAFVEPGDVIMAAADQFAGLAVVGDRVAGMARNRGAVALVTDGMARDTPGIRAAGLPLFCRGVTPNSCAASGPGTVGEPVVVGGVAVQSGDVVVGDCDGVVVVPQARIAAVLARLDRVRAAEAEMDARVADGLGVPPKITALLASPRVRFLE
ncbi:MAG: 4-hydroxy-4-methyl-2-oxoglutarate aldolase [Acidisphaera sp.]|nr:4-hydroxy-4-methyl-2-oxoglutarate aldolase [Acidisphaera sp.]